MTEWPTNKMTAGWLQAGVLNQEDESVWLEFGDVDGLGAWDILQGLTRGAGPFGCRLHS